MAEFQEVILQFHRMCKSGNCIEIKTCPLMKKPSNESCVRYAFENPCDFENTVMSWAADHSELKYPTWLEWLTEQGILSASGVWDNVFQPIPADIAEKLGIKPKEEY